jgi:hypothetical protein
LLVTLPVSTRYLDADPIRLVQVFGNLLTNACKYTPPGGRIELIAECVGSEAVVRVRDSGVGIPTDMLPRVFDIFTQVDRTLERAQCGLGIGLALVRQLVDMHGGSVTAYSAGLGQGSEFIVRLPLGIEAMLLEPATLEDPAPPKAPVRSRRILVVDDNRDSALTLAMLLRMEGHEITTAHDGLEALASAESLLPDVILLDLGLPKMHGYDVCRKIRGAPWGQHMVIVALTGWGAGRRSAQVHGCGLR